jgi:hypothetical protein
MSTEKTQISKIRNQKGGKTTNTMEIQRIIRDYIENLHSNKLENLEEMDKFLDTYDHPKLNQEDINHLNRSITHNGIEAAIVSQNRKVQVLTDSQLNSTIKEEPIQTFLKLFHELEREGTLSNSFYEASITLIQKLDNKYNTAH